MPKDPIMLMSYVNTKLRDEYTSLEEFCRAEDTEEKDLTDRLAEAGFQYYPEINQFR